MISRRPSRERDELRRRTLFARVTGDRSGRHTSGRSTMKRHAPRIRPTRVLLGLAGESATVMQGGRGIARGCASTAASAGSAGAPPDRAGKSRGEACGPLAKNWSCSALSLMSSEFSSSQGVCCRHTGTFRGLVRLCAARSGPRGGNLATTCRRVGGMALLARRFLSSFVWLRSLVLRLCRSLSESRPWTRERG